jgi:replication factor A1
MDIADIIRKISEETNIEEKEIKVKIENKQKELGGLITIEGAAHIVANEMGINLFESISKKPELKIENIIPGMNSVDIIGRVMRVFEPKEFEKEDGSRGRVCSIILGDDTGTIRTVFWGKDVSLIERGDIEEGKILRIRDGYTKENINGEPELHIGIRTRVIPNPKDVDDKEIPLPEERKKKIADLTEDTSSVDVVCKIIRIYEPREFERDDDTKGKVVNLIVGDETGRGKLVLWDEDVALVEEGRIKEGDTIKVKRGYVKMRFQEPEINVGRYGKIVLNPEEEIGEVPEESPAEITRKNMSDLSVGEKAEIRGALVEVYENLKIFDRDDGKGMVINAVIDDGTAAMRAAFYDRMAEILLNMPLKKALESDITEEISQRRKQLLGKEVIAIVRVIHNEFSGRAELVVEDINLNPDPKVEAEILLKEAKQRTKEE